MGRGKIEIKKIENVTQRKVTFTKRHKGLQKKAYELSSLCDAQVSLVVFDSSGKMQSWCSDKSTFEKILEHYHDKKGSSERLWDAKHQDLSNEIERIKKENDSIQLQLRHLKGEELQCLQIEELQVLERSIADAADKVRKQKIEFFNMVKRNHKQLEVQNADLQYIVEQLENANRYNQQTVRDCNSQVPFCYRVLPMQPNLHDGLY